VGVEEASIDQNWARKIW